MRKLNEIIRQHTYFGYQSVLLCCKTRHAYSLIAPQTILAVDAMATVKHIFIKDENSRRLLSDIMVWIVVKSK